MFLRSQVCDLNWQPWQKASKVSFSTPPTPATQSANLQVVFDQEVFDHYGFALGDVFDVTFVKTANDYTGAPDEVVFVVEGHERHEWDAPSYVRKEDGTLEVGPVEHKRNSMVRMRPLTGDACKGGMLVVSVDTAHVEYGHEPGDRFVLRFKPVERRATVHAA